ncbi:MAG: hypothetical protein BGN86_16125 [Caulobacterales bacterium 68-7]|nr:hypothetical protein [Caulobacterales bacterium]OJU12178.1 MAG: hypothetical protein BGN86_16125 [Caulobacterales bacterium 68-7]
MAENNNHLQSQVRPSERAKGVAAIQSLLRLMSLMRDCYPQDDFEKVAVFLSVVSASTGWTLRDKQLLRGMGAGPLPDGLQRHISARAVAESLAMPRETVRRKLRELAASGKIIEGPEGFRIPSDAIHKDRNLEFCRGIVAEFQAAPRRISQFDELDG